MVKRSQASSSRAGFGGRGFFATSSGSALSYLAEPPDLSSIGDANIVVAFKNLLKRDDTTKYRALEELRTYARAHPYQQDGGVEDPILDAWVSMLLHFFLSLTKSFTIETGGIVSQTIYR
jgi:hypothetical protein